MYISFTKINCTGGMPEMDMELNMLTAHQMRRQGLKINEIATQIEKSERTVYYYLSKQPCKALRESKPGKLDPFKPYIDTILQDDPDFNRVVLYEKLKKLGYTGKISILRDYARKKSDDIKQKIIIRFETEPGFQAQVDWMYLGKKMINGKLEKVYGFVMVMGYSRKAFVLFTTSMTQSVFLACHILAFIYFGGVPHEILYDNMKTAFIYDGMETKWKPNRALLSFAHYYGFIPRRCRIRRPQTKGKVERFIHYVRNNFMSGIENDHFNSLSDWNYAVLDWLKQINGKPLRDFKENRNERFKKEVGFLIKLPEIHYDCRETIDLKVSRESFIMFKTNRYSVPPEYISKILTLKVHPFEMKASIYYQSHKIRDFNLEVSGSYATVYCDDDKDKIKKVWEKQNIGVKRLRSVKKAVSELSENIEIRNPDVYDAYYCTQEALCSL